MEILTVAILSTILPGLAVIIALSAWSRSLEEEGKPINKAFYAGFLAPLPAVLLQALLLPLTEGSDGLTGIAIDAYVVTAATEETMKILAVLITMNFKKVRLETKGPIRIAAAVATGFALFESLLYVLSAGGAIQVALLRSLTSLPLHILTGCWALALFNSTQGTHDGILKGLSPSILGGWLIAILLHGTYAMILAVDGIPSWLIFLLLIVGYAPLLLKIRMSSQETG